MTLKCIYRNYGLITYNHNSGAVHNPLLSLNARFQDIACSSILQLTCSYFKNGTVALKHLPPMKFLNDTLFNVGLNPRLD